MVKEKEICDRCGDLDNLIKIPIVKNITSPIFSEVWQYNQEKDVQNLCFGCAKRYILSKS